jgi:nucleoside-diphosphate-sugar epimerase
VELTAGEQLRDYMDVCDAAEAFWRAMASRPQDNQLRVLNVASGQVITLRDFCEKLAEELRSANYTPDLNFGIRPYRSDEMMNYTADITLLKETLQWQPKTSLKDGLRRLLADS